MVEPVDFVPKDEISGALDSLKRNLDSVIELNAIKAQIRWANYKCLIDAGFSEEQALGLCKDII